MDSFVLDDGNCVVSGVDAKIICLAGSRALDIRSAVSTERALVVFVFRSAKSGRRVRGNYNFMVRDFSEYNSILESAKGGRVASRALSCVGELCHGFEFCNLAYKLNYCAKNKDEMNWRTMIGDGNQRKRWYNNV